MEKFNLERPSFERKDEIIEYINEFVEYNSEINGTGGLDKIIEGYTFEQALERCLSMEDANYAKKINRCQSKTFLLIRENDNRIVGTINVRWNLTEAMKRFGGNIGYGIRPTERRKRYATQMLEKALKYCKEELNLEKVMLGCYKENEASRRTILNAGGILERELKTENGKIAQVYWIKL